MELNLEIDKAVGDIIRFNAKKVCIQLPDGLKPRAAEIQEIIQRQTNVEVLIWANSCFGACDMPQGLDKLGVDLLIQWGHTNDD